MAFQSAVSLAYGTVQGFLNHNHSTSFELSLWAFIFAVQLLLSAAIVVRAGETADYGNHEELPISDHARLRDMPLENFPMVSIHLPCSNEPPEVVIASLNALARLRYPHFEVLVVDNNTEDPALWKPLEDHCRILGPRFRFFSLGSRPGFKAGALNYALGQTHPDARLVGIVDADWLVEPDWLEYCAPYFSDPNVGSVQGIQSYRDGDASLFKRIENDECAGPYQLALVRRDRDNAAPLLGAMALFEKDSLKEAGGWNEKVIGEDLELGIRILNQRKRCIYLDGKIQGRGLLPQDFSTYVRQRQRWCYGAFYVLKLHWAWIRGKSGSLTPIQQHHFFMEFLNLGGFALYPIFAILAFLGGLWILKAPGWQNLPPDSLLLSALILVLTHFLNLGWVFGSRLGIGKWRVFLLILAKLSLVYPVSKAVWLAILKRSLIFHRTDRYRQSLSFFQSCYAVAGPITAAFVFLALVAAIFEAYGMTSFHGWMLGFCLIATAFPFLAAIAINAISYFSNRRPKSSSILGVPQF